jgi:hypothetical protein
VVVLEVVVVVLEVVVVVQMLAIGLEIMKPRMKPRNNSLPI